MSPSEKKKRKTTTKKPSLKPSPTPESTPIPSLPDDLLLSCFARVSRLYYLTLSLASKRFRSLLASPELYQVRSSLGHQESCLYVCLLFPPYPNPNPRWFTLCRNPNKTLTYHNPQNNKKKKKSSGNALATLPIPHSPPTHLSGLVTIGSNIYNIGGCAHKSPSSSVSILDCRSHTWREAPSMRIPRNNPVANVLDGKIYVVGGCDSSNWMEVFDPETQTWELVLSPAAEIGDVRKGATIDGKIYIGWCNGLAYEPNENSWERVGWKMFSSWRRNSYCVVENVIYCYYPRHFTWYDTKVRTWRYLKGMERLPMFAESSHVKLAEYGGKMAVLWDRVLASSGYKNKMISCAVIALEKRNDEEIWGKVEWFDAVLTVPKSYEFVHALSATV